MTSGSGILLGPTSCGIFSRAAAARRQADGPTHLAFQRGTGRLVEAFYRAGLDAGGTDNGGPANGVSSGLLRSVLLDPDGNNIEAAYHGEPPIARPKSR